MQAKSTQQQVVISSPEVERLILDFNNQIEVPVLGAGGLFKQKRIWCNHCLMYLVLPEEAKSHANMFRATACCVYCSAWCYLDQNIQLEHKPHCERTDFSYCYPDLKRFM